MSRHQVYYTSCLAHSIVCTIINMWKFVSYSCTPVFLIVQLVFLSQSNVSANEFYVVADDGFNCPVNRSCETIDYYINNQTRYFVSDTIFYFLEGTHFIQPEQTLLITSVIIPRNSYTINSYFAV